MELNEIGKALCKAQAAMKHALKDSENPHFKSRYADLASVIDALRKPFGDNGLSFVQLPDGDNLTTMLVHESGQTITSNTPIIYAQRTAQAYGSGLTYARRYALAAIAGIAQDDDDANDAMPPHPQKPAKQLAPPVKQQAPENSDRGQRILALLHRAHESGLSAEEISNWLQTDDHTKATDAAYKALSSAIDRKIAATRS